MFYLFIVMKAIEIGNMFRYPATMNCPSIASLFKGNNTEYAYYAGIDKPFTLDKQGTGIYQCYCKSEGYAELASSGLDDNSLCKAYVWQFGGGYVLSELVSVVITVVNIIIRTFCIFMIKRVGYWTLTGEISAIMVTVFIMTFFNTAILLLLADASFKDNPTLSWLPGFNGPFPDLTEEWYIVIAPSLIFTMFLNACSPLIEICTAFLTSIVFRALDQGCSNYCCCKGGEKPTKCKTIQEYVNLYGGPPHTMSTKYSALMSTVCVTFMYGAALPELWLIAAFCYFNYYVIEKFLITYYYQRPPMYDDKLNKTSLKLMKGAPLFLCFFGYWCMGNMQIFQNNKVSLLENQSIPISTNHTIWPSGNQALPLFMIGLCIMLGLIFTALFSKCLKKMSLIEDEAELVIDEKLGTFFECMSVWDRKQWLAQEVHSKQKLGIETMGEWTFEQLRTSQTHPNKVIKNTPSYELVCNP